MSASQSKTILIQTIFRTNNVFRCRYRLRHRSTRRRFLLITIVFIYFEFPYNVTFKLVYHQRNAFLSTYLKKTTVFFMSITFYHLTHFNSAFITQLQIIHASTLSGMQAIISFLGILQKRSTSSASSCEPLTSLRILIASS